MNLLISNDDSVNTPDILSLAESLGKIANISVSAPHRDSRGTANSLILDRPLRPTFLETDFVCINNMPVHAAVKGYASITPIHVEMTKNDAFSDLNHWLEDVM